MAQLSEAIVRYHEFLHNANYRDLEWAEQLQEHMRRQGLTDSGRLLSPVLRPHFISKEQLTRLSTVSSRLSDVLGKIEALLIESPQLLNRVHMLPAEKALAVMPCGYTRPCMTSRLDVAVQDGLLNVRGFEASTAIGLAYSDVLAEIFLSLPIMRELVRSGFKATKLGGVSQLLGSILKAWEEFGGSRRAKIAVLEVKTPGASTTEGQFIAELFRRSGHSACAVTPEQLAFSKGRLHASDFEIDIVFRRLDTRELLTRCELSHPLWAACRENAVCLVNGFRSEIWQHRAAFELVTDETVTAFLSAAERKLIRESVPWTRYLSSRKTSYKGAFIDLVPFLLANRDRFVLRPNDVVTDQSVFPGNEMAKPAWERALRLAMQSPYVVQEICPMACEKFPVFRYGELQVQELGIAISPHVFDGAVHGASAVLQTCPPSSARPVALAPVLTIQ